MRASSFDNQMNPLENQLPEHGTGRSNVDVFEEDLHPVGGGKTKKPHVRGMNA